MENLVIESYAIFYNFHPKTANDFVKFPLVARSEKKIHKFVIYLSGDKMRKCCNSMPTRVTTHCVVSRR